MDQFLSPFTTQSVAQWIEELQRAESGDGRYRALLAVVSTGTPMESFRWCRSSLRDADAGVRALAAKTLGELKRRSIEGNVDWAEIVTGLTDGLVDEDPDVRFESARALGRIDAASTKARDVLVSLLDDAGTQPLMIAVVVTALAGHSDANAEILIPRLRLLMAHPQAEVRENVSAAVAGCDAMAAALVGELITALDDDEPIVRENAASALGRSGIASPEVLAALTAAGEDEDEGVAEAARNARVRLVSG
jgi:HEAT repeat protein